MSISSLLSVNYKTNTSQYITLVFVAAWAFYAGFDLYKRYKVRFLVPKLILWIITALLTYIYAGKVIVRLITGSGF